MFAILLSFIDQQAKLTTILKISQKNSELNIDKINKKKFS